MEYIALRNLKHSEKKQLKALSTGKSNFYLLIRNIKFMCADEYTASIVIQDGKVTTIIYKQYDRIAEAQTSVMGNILKISHGNDHFFIRVA